MFSKVEMSCVIYIVHLACAEQAAQSPQALPWCLTTDAAEFPRSHCSSQYLQAEFINYTHSSKTDIYHSHKYISNILIMLFNSNGE